MDLFLPGIGRCKAGATITPNNGKIIENVNFEEVAEAANQQANNTQAQVAAK